jgi:hypothetical protein
MPASGYWSKIKLDYFDPFRYCDLNRAKLINSTDKSGGKRTRYTLQVLLKNDNNILPLKNRAP